jgi:hypothetical protein
VRRFVGAAVLAAAVVLLGACGTPAGVDGNLINGWGPLSEAKIPVPPTAACYSVTTDDPATVSRWPAPVDCTASHNVETVHVGQFTGDEGSRNTPPSTGSPARRRAYETCTAEAKTYLGDDWRTGRLDLALVTPIALHWEAGARWFRCDVVEYNNLDEYAIVARTSSIRGALTGDRPVGLGCVVVTLKGNEIDRMTQTPCSESHNGEFAGIFDAPDGPWPTDVAAARALRLNGCRAVVAAFANVPNDNNLQYRVGQIATPFTKNDWDLGNRGVRCWLWTSPKNVTTSLKGAGVGALPINYG